MADAASPAASESENKRGEVTYRFCPEWWVVLHHIHKWSLFLTSCSSNLLYPKEDRTENRLKFVCKACTAVTEHDTACTYRHHLGSTVTETAGVTTDVANDPTVGDTSLEVYFCTMCGDALRCAECGVSAVEDGGVEDIPDAIANTGSFSWCFSKALFFKALADLLFATTASTSGQRVPEMWGIRGRLFSVPTASGWYRNGKHSTAMILSYTRCWNVFTEAVLCLHILQSCLYSPLNVWWLAFFSFGGRAWLWWRSGIEGVLDSGCIAWKFNRSMASVGVL